MSSIACRMAWGWYNGLELASLQNLYSDFPKAAAEVLQVMADHGHKINVRKADYRRAMRKKHLGFGECQFHCHPVGSVCYLPGERAKLNSRSGGDFYRPGWLGNYRIEEPHIKEEEENVPNLGVAQSQKRTRQSQGFGREKPRDSAARRKKKQRARGEEQENAEEDLDFSSLCPQM
jgi:hypothetical protein